MPATRANLLHFEARVCMSRPISMSAAVDKASCLKQLHGKTGTQQQQQ